MAITHNTLALDQTAWDLVLDAAGNIALASAPYAIAQDVASAVRTFAGECWYDTTKGVPYWGGILDERPSPQFVKQALTNAAKSVADVAEAQTVLTSYSERVLTGQVQVIDTDGVASGVTF